MYDNTDDFLIKEINVNDLVFDIRTRVQCVYCEKFGKKLTCPPNIPDLNYFKLFFQRYKRGIILIKCYELNEVNRELSTREMTQKIIDLENEYKHQGFYYTAGFIGGSCKECEKCPNSGCANIQRSRIPIEATGIDVIKTCEKIGCKLERPGYRNMFCRVGLVLIE